MGINQYMCSVADEMISAPTGQGEIQPERAAPCLGQLRATALCSPETRTRKSRGATSWASLMYEGMCSWHEEMSLAVPDFPPGLSLLRNAPQPTQHWISPLSIGITQIGRTLSLGMSFAAYSQLF